MTALNETHDPARRSGVESAHPAESDFPIQNLPFGRFRTAAGEPWRMGLGACAGTGWPAP